jgi:hypothetical protein
MHNREGLQNHSASVDEAITNEQEFWKGNRLGLIDALYGMNFKPRIDGCYKEKSSMGFWYLQKRISMRLWRR